MEIGIMSVVTVVFFFLLPCRGGEGGMGGLNTAKAMRIMSAVFFFLLPCRGGEVGGWGL